MSCSSQASFLRELAFELRDMVLPLPQTHWPLRAARRKTSLRRSADWLHAARKKWACSGAASPAHRGCRVAGCQRREDDRLRMILRPHADVREHRVERRFEFRVFEFVAVKRIRPASARDSA